MNSIIYLIRQLWKQWFIIFAATIGLISGILTIFPIKNNTLLLDIIIFSSCLFLSLIVTLVIYKSKHISDDEIWILEVPNEKPAIAFPYHKKFLRAANELARTHYGKNALGYGVVKKWYEKNPLLITILTDEHNKFVGYFDILPLTDIFGQKFIEGIVKESDISHSDILGPEEMQKTEYLYFAGISVKDPYSQKGRKYGSILIYSAMVYLDSLYDLNEGKKLYAIAASDCGRNILKKLKFRIETDETERKDKLDLYSRMITKADIEVYKQKFCFLEQLCDYSEYYLLKETGEIRI